MKRIFYRGFTLIEIMVVVAIIGLLASIVTIWVSTARAQAQTAAAITSEHQMTLGAGLNPPGGQWPLSEGNGTTVSSNGDGVGSGTLAGGATFSTDVPLNQAYSIALPTPDASITFPVQSMGTGASNNTNSPGVTMGAWFKYTGTGGVLFTYGNSSDYMAVKVLDLVQGGTGAILDSGQVYLYSGSTGGGGSRFDLHTPGIGDGKWHYIVASMDTATKAFSIYVDGKNTPSHNTHYATPPAFLSDPSPMQLTVGTAYGLPGAVGEVSDPFIFNASII